MGEFLGIFRVVPLITIAVLVAYSDAAGKSSNDCNKGAEIENAKSKAEWTVKLPLKEPKCIFEVFGNDECDVEVTCNVDIPKSDDCDDDYLKITDGVSGETLVCGQTEGTWLPSEGLRHLFLVVETTGKSGSVSCTAKCNKKTGGNRVDKKNKRKIDSRCACGFQNKDDRIVGGEDAKMNEFPWISPVVFPKTRSPMCGSSIINDRYILTAAHCFWFDKKKASAIEVLFHAHTLDMTKQKGAKDVKLGKDGSIRSSGYDAEKKTDEAEGTQRYQVEKIINHPLFNEYYDYDFALLRLTKKLDLSAADAPTPICIPPANTFDSMMDTWASKKLAFTVAGWGKAAENAGGSTRVLQKLDVPYIDWKKCLKIMEDAPMTRRMICAGFEKGGKDACTGDSGGPLVYKMPTKQFWQLGVVSWGEGCARENRPGIYSRVTDMVQWIEFHTSEGDAKWCEGPKPVDAGDL